MPRHHSKSSELLKCVLAMLLSMGFLFAIYQYIVAEWTTATLWLAAVLVGMVALFTRSGKAVMASMILMSALLFAAMIVHIVILATIPSHTSKSFPGQSMAIDDWSYGEIRRMEIVTHTLGLIFTILFALFTIPTMLFLASAVRHREKHRPDSGYRGSTNTGYAGPGNVPPTGGQQGYAPPAGGQGGYTPTSEV